MRSIGVLSLCLLQASMALGSVLVRQFDAERAKLKLAALDQTWRENFTEDEFCHKYSPQANVENAEKVWKEFNIDKWFDAWLELTPDNDIADWAVAMDKDYHRNSESQYHCHYVNQTCNLPGDCKVHYQNGAGPAYWILFGASRLHEIMGTFKSNLQEARNEQVLDVDGMIEELGLNRVEPEINKFGLLNGAFTIAAGITASAPALSVPLTIVAGALGMAGSVSREEYVRDASIPYERAVYEGYKNTIERMDGFLASIFSPLIGQSTLAWQGRDENRPNRDAYEAVGMELNHNRRVGINMENGVPGLIGEARHPLVRFFGEGRFLRKDLAAGLLEVQHSYEVWHRAGLAARMLKDSNWVIVINTDIKEESKCKDDPGRDFWDEEFKRCYRTMRYESKLGCSEGPHFRKWDGGVVNTAISKYNMARKEYYRGSYECAKKYPDGDGEPKDEPRYTIDKKLPECYFNMPVIEASFWSWDGPGLKLMGDEEPSINTVNGDPGCQFRLIESTSRGGTRRVDGPSWHNTRPGIKKEIEYL